MRVIGLLCIPERGQQRQRARKTQKDRQDEQTGASTLSHFSHALLCRSPTASFRAPAALARIVSRPTKPRLLDDSAARQPAYQTRRLHRQTISTSPAGSSTRE